MAGWLAACCGLVALRSSAVCRRILYVLQTGALGVRWVAPSPSLPQVAFPVGSGAALTFSAEALLLLPWGARALDAPTSISGEKGFSGMCGGGLRWVLPSCSPQHFSVPFVNRFDMILCPDPCHFPNSRSHQLATSFHGQPGRAVMRLYLQHSLLVQIHPNLPTPIADRFFLGGLGAGTLRGFAQKGAGPSEPRRPSAEVRSACTSPVCRCMHCSCAYVSWPMCTSLSANACISYMHGFTGGPPC